MLQQVCWISLHNIIFKLVILLKIEFKNDKFYKQKLEFSRLSSHLRNLGILILKNKIKKIKKEKRQRSEFRLIIIYLHSQRQK